MRHFARTIRRAAACVVTALAIAVPLATPAAAAPDSAIVVDVKTGKVLYSLAADGKRYPASLTKMMTLYMVFEALETGKLTLNTPIKFSANAANEAPSKIGLKAGQSIQVKDAILALVTKSANDVATALGEHIGGSEAEFARMMTRRAREIGMTNTTFRNANGLPNTSQVTTARDMATLGRALQEHYPQYFHYFKTPSFTYRGVRYGNHNRLLGRVNGVTGIKTGYTRASGFNLVTSASSGGREIVAVVIDGETSRWRDARMTELVNKYLPKASSGAHTAAAIPGGPSHRVAMQVAEADEYPVPRMRPGARPDVDEMTVASVIGANSIFALDAAQAQGAPIELAPAQGDASDGPDGDVIETTAPDGWKIQLAATPTLDAAEDVLNRAMTTAPSVLASVTPYTEPVAKGSSTLYRARFGGFDGKAAARNACIQMKKKKFDCIALQ